MSSFLSGLWLAWLCWCCGVIVLGAVATADAMLHALLCFIPEDGEEASRGVPGHGNEWPRPSETSVSRD
jgi:hypothetical protein